MFRVMKLCVLTTVLVGVAFTSRVEAAVFDVINPAEFQAALTAAQSNGEDDTINVGVCAGAGCSSVSGQSIYDITSTLTYTAAAGENQELTIAGFDSDTRILSGGDLVAIMRIDTRGADNDFNTLVTVQDLTFVNGNTPDDGGALAVLVEGPLVSITGSVFLDNTAGDNGGAAYVRVEGAANEANVHIADVTFDGNEALGIPNGSGGDGGNGGSVYVSATGFSGVDIIDVDFLDSTADRNGGCIAVEGLDPTDVVFRRVTSVTLNDVLLEDCSAGLYGGGAFFAANGYDIRITGFVRNSAPNADGGGLYIAPGWTSLNMVNTGFVSNMGYQGGGFFVGDSQGGFAYITNNTVYQNTATDGDGGNVYLTLGGSTGLGRVFNNIIYNGSAAGFGDDIYIDNDPFTDIPSLVEFIANDLGEVPVAPSFTNDSFFIRSSAELTLEDNIDAMPLLPNILDLVADPRQAAGSPTIDAGRDDLATFGDDFEGDIRPLDGDGDSVARFDIGMDEFQPVAVPEADLGVAVTAAPSPVTELETLTYGITVDNNGPDDATSVVMTATLDSGLSAIVATPGQGSCSISATVVTCTLGDIADSADAVVTITASAPAVSENGALSSEFVVAGAEADPVSSNDRVVLATAVVPAGPAQADLAVTKNAAPEPIVSRGPELIYTVTVQNNGPDDATSVVLSDTLPIDDVRFVGVTLSNGGSCPDPDAFGVLTCELGSLAVNANVTANITTVPLAVDTTESITNTAVVSGVELDPVGSNNVSSAVTTVNPPQADIAVRASAPTEDPLINEEVSVDVTVSNAGPSDGEDVTLVVALPASVAVASIQPAQGSCSIADDTATCVLGQLPVDASIVTAFRLVGPSTPQSLTLSATVSSDVTEVDPSNNSASATVDVIDAVPVRIRGKGGKSSSIGLFEVLLGILALVSLKALRRRQSRLNAIFPSVLVLILGLPISQARAEDWYVGAAGGESQLDYGSADLIFDVASRGWLVENPSVDDSDTAWKAYLGYRVTDYLAVEGAYVNLGEVVTGFDSLVAPPALPELLNDTLDVHPYLGDGWALSGVGRWPLGAEAQFAVYARAGVFFWEADIEVKATGGASGRVSGDETGEDFFYGFGAEWRAHPRVFVTLEWERYRLNDWVDVPMLGFRLTF